MKITLLLASLFALSVHATAQQNHVQNGSFEYYTTCPTGISQVNKCIGWRQYTNGSSDYFHLCNNSVPNALAGYQQPAHGQAYMGGYQYYRGHTYQYKEYIAAPITPLIPGRAYEVSMSISLGNNSHYGCNDMGVYFYDTAAYSVSTYDYLNVTPQVSYASYGPIMDTANWVRVTKTFVADSAYDNIVIGGFGAYNNLLLDSLTNTGVYTYYYVDSVVIKLADSFLHTFADTLLCTGDTVHIPYLVLKNYQSNNVFSAQLSNSTGGFSSPVNIGAVTSNVSGTITAVIPLSTPTGTGYKIRLVASSPADTTKDYGLNIKIGVGISQVTALNNGPVCANDTLKLSANTSTGGVSYKWTGPNSFTSTIQNPKIANPVPANAGDYIVTAQFYGCLSKDTTTAVIFNGTGSTGVAATSNSPVCVNDTLKLFGTATGSSLTYTWSGPGSYSSNQQNPKIIAATTAASGDYILFVSNGSCTVRDTVAVLVKPRPAAFTAMTNAPLCTGNTLNFTASSTSPGVTYLWTGPNSFNSTSPTPSIGGASSVHDGDYFITATLNGCSLKDTLQVIVKALPAKPAATSNGPVCSGATLNLFSSSSTGGVIYTWTGPNSYTSNQQNPVISNTTTSHSGNYVVSANLNGCNTKDTAAVTVKPLPMPVTLSTNSPVCAGNSLQLNSDTSSPGSTYAWTGPNSFTANTRNTTLSNTTITATGWYKMTVTLAGCTYKDSISATVYPIPASPGVSYNSPLCVGETLNLNAGVVAGAVYAWTGPGSFAATGQAASRSNMQFGDTGVYHVTATVNGCTSPAGAATVHINPVPFVVILANPRDSICKGDPVVFTALPNNAGGTPQYNWLVNAQAAGTGAVFSTSVLNDKDIVSCAMTEYTKCYAPYNDASNDIEMTVLPWLAPSVTISANPNRPLDPDEFVTFTTTATNAGLLPKYQWKRNGQNVQGATSNVWSANTLNDNDSISVEIVSGYKCPQPVDAKSNGIRVRVLTSVAGVGGLTGLTLYPNPNKGRFTLAGQLPNDEMIKLEVINAIGQQVYKESAVLHAGILNIEIDLGQLAIGVYLLRIQSETGNVSAIRFRVE